MQRECPLGFTRAEIVELIPHLENFDKWMIGQTGAICDGSFYNHDLRRREAGACADNPHGPVVYAWDVEQYLSGGDPLD